MYRLTVIIAFALIVVAAACGGDDENNTTPGAGEGTPHSGPGVGFYFSIEEIVLGPNGYVTIKNFTDTDANIGALYICQPPMCFDLPDAVVKAGRVARIAVGDGGGVDDVVATHTGLVLSPSDGEVALYGSKDLDDPAAIRTYLEWGKTPHEATEVAVTAAIWLHGSYAPTAASATRLYRTDANLWVFDAE